MALRCCCYRQPSHAAILALAPPTVPPLSTPSLVHLHARRRAVELSSPFAVR